jgi:hypothetical protein
MQCAEGKFQSKTRPTGDTHATRQEHNASSAGVTQSVLCLREPHGVTAHADVQPTQPMSICTPVDTFRHKSAPVMVSPIRRHPDENISGKGIVPSGAW